jgi:uncharacterized protein (TIGR02680 family)
VSTAHRAGIEAALEASGLLDAWITPDGVVLADPTHPFHDTAVVARPRCPASLAAWLHPSGPISDGIIVRLLEGIACSKTDDGSAESWLSPEGSFRFGSLSGSWNKPVAAYIGFAAREAARLARINAIGQRLARIADALRHIASRLDEIRRLEAEAADELNTKPADTLLHEANASAAQAAATFNNVNGRLAEAERILAEFSASLKAKAEELAFAADAMHLPHTRQELDELEKAVRHATGVLNLLIIMSDGIRTAVPDLAQQRERLTNAKADAAAAAEDLEIASAAADASRTRYEVLQSTKGAKVEEFQRLLKDAETAVQVGEKTLNGLRDSLSDARLAHSRALDSVDRTDQVLAEAIASRRLAVDTLQKFAATGMLSAALPEIEIPDVRATWALEPGLILARRANEAIGPVADEDKEMKRALSQIGGQFTELGQALTSLGEHCQGEQTEFGMVVTIVFQNRQERPDRLIAKLSEEIAERKRILTDKERQILEGHLQSELAVEIQRLILGAAHQVDSTNGELDRRPTSTGVRFRLQWKPLSEGEEGAPVGLEAARKHLFNTKSELWSAEDRKVVGAMLQQCISRDRDTDIATEGGRLEQLARALDYRKWHRFTVERQEGRTGKWTKLSGPASSGERALGLTVPLFAAVASFYSQSEYKQSPRLVLMDEAFAGIDDDARANCMSLIGEFDLDFVMTSEREWACYKELAGVSICQLQRREGIEGVHVSRWVWNGKSKQRVQNPDRRFEDA